MADLKIERINDVRPVLSDFVKGIKFKGNASFDGFCKFVFLWNDDKKYRDLLKVEHLRMIFSDYLRSVGEKLKDYIK